MRKGEPCIRKAKGLELSREVWERVVTYLTGLDAMDQDRVWVPQTPPSTHDALKKTESANTKTPGQ